MSITNKFQSKIIKIDSSKAQEYLNEYHTSFLYRFDELRCELNESFVYSLISCNIPYSFYSCNQDNNYLDIQETKNGVISTVHIQISEGNYNSYEFSKELMTKLNDNTIHYNIIYNKIKNKYQFNITTVGCSAIFLFNTGQHNGISCKSFLGFDMEDINITNNITESTNCITMNDVIYLQIKSDLGENNMVMSTNDDHILEIIPITSQIYTTIAYKPTEINKYLMHDKQISHINISLQDNHGFEINLNKIPYYMTIKLEVINNNENNIPYNLNPREDKTNLDMIKEQPDLIDKASEQKPITMNDHLDHEKEIQQMTIKEYIDLKNLESMLNEFKK
jgi:hypothetical protein